MVNSLEPQLNGVLLSLCVPMIPEVIIDGAL